LVDSFIGVGSLAPRDKKSSITKKFLHYMYTGIY